MEEIHLESRNEDDLNRQIARYEHKGWRKKGEMRIRAGMFVDLLIQVMVREAYSAECEATWDPEEF